jgi:hypothetical protein
MSVSTAGDVMRELEARTSARRRFLKRGRGTKARMHILMTRSVMHNSDGRERTLGSRLRHKTSNRSWACHNLHLQHAIQRFSVPGGQRQARLKGRCHRQTKRLGRTAHRGACRGSKHCRETSWLRRLGAAQ